MQLFSKQSAVNFSGAIVEKQNDLGCGQKGKRGVLRNEVCILVVAHETVCSCVSQTDVGVSTSLFSSTHEKKTKTDVIFKKNKVYLKHNAFTEVSVT